MRKAVVTVALLLSLAFGVAAQEAPRHAAEDTEVAAARAAVEKAEAALLERQAVGEGSGRTRRLRLLQVARDLEGLIEALATKGLPRDAEATRLRDVYRDLAASVERDLRGGADIGVQGGWFGRTEGRARPASPAAADALDWLARHQSANGSFDCDGFPSLCRGSTCGGPGAPLYDVGCTGLALAAFVRAGETHKTPLHGAVVRNAIKYLKSVQDAEGCFGERAYGHFTYNHAVATLGVAEALRSTRSPLFEGSVRSGVSFILECRNPYLAWRYGVKPGDDDTSVTGWMVAALVAAREGGVPADPEAFKGALAWLDRVTEPQYGRVGYTAQGNGPARPMPFLDEFPPDKSESLTAEGCHVRLVAGQPKDHAFVVKGLALMDRVLPLWDAKQGTIDLYYWYFGTLVKREAAGDAEWARWRGAAERALLPNQRPIKDGCSRGSWEPLDPWRADGGRVYTTAVAALTLLACDGRETAK